MKTKLLLPILAIAAFSSCTTMYKSGQTPDDVYFSPARSFGEGDVRKDDREEDDRYVYNDRVIRMGIADPRWRYLDFEYGYNSYYNPYNYGFNHGYYYNPYYWPYPVYAPIFTVPTNPKISTPRTTNLGGYGSVAGYSNLPNSKTGRVNGVTRYNNSNNGSAVGNTMRRIIAPDNGRSYNNTSNNNNNNNSNNNTRSYSPSSSGSSSSGSSSSGGGAISRPARTGN